MTAAAQAAPGVIGAERTRARPYTVDIDIGGTLTDGLFSDGTTVVVDGVNVQGFATGILTTSMATGGNVTVSNSTITDNRGVGVLAQAGTISVLESRLVSNQVAVQADPFGTVRLSNNDVMNNKTGFGCGGGVLASAGNNRKAGNVGGVVPTCAPNAAITVQ